jgi:hypothetical protein
VTALGAACGQDQTAVLGGHARTKAVAALANQVRRLKGALHRGSPSDLTRTRMDSKARNLKPVLYGRSSPKSTQAEGISCNISQCDAGKCFIPPGKGPLRIKAA